MFSPELAEKPFVVAYNKMDLAEAYENWSSFKDRLEARGIKTFCMSAVKKEGTYEVICAAYEILQKSKAANWEYEGLTFSCSIHNTHIWISRFSCTVYCFALAYSHVHCIKSSTCFRVWRTSRSESCS